MEEENLDNIDNLSNNFSNKEEINDDYEEEMKPISEIFDEDEFDIEDNFKEDKKEEKEEKEEKENSNDNKIKINENILLKESFNEEEKVDFFPIDYLIPTEEINSIDINKNGEDPINNDDNENKRPLNNNFFLTNIASKIKETISRRN